MIKVRAEKSYFEVSLFGERLTTKDQIILAGRSDKNGCLTIVPKRRGFKHYKLPARFLHFLSTKSLLISNSCFY